MKAVSPVVAEAMEQPWAYNVADFAVFFSRRAGKPWYAYRWLEHMLDQVQDHLLAGDARIILNAPPRHGKSESISIWTVLWYLWWYPEKTVIIAAFEVSLSAGWTGRVRDIIEADSLLSARIPLDRRYKSRTEWKTMLGGGVKATSTGGGITGKGGHFIIYDDPHPGWTQALSPTMRKQVHDFFDDTLSNRQEPPLNQPGGFIINHTRWHEEDLTGYLLDQASKNPEAAQWTQIVYRALAEHDDVLGRKLDDALCPERVPQAKLLPRKLYKSFIGVYQQRPAALAGTIILKEYIRHYTELPAQPKRVTISWDLTFEDDGTSYVVGQIWWQHKGAYYLLDQVRGKWGFVAQLRNIQSMYDRCIRDYGQVAHLLIEKAANGSAVIDVIKGKFNNKTLVAERPCKSKEVRLMSVSPIYEEGRVYYPPRTVEWVDDMVHEVTNFGAVKNDDQVDAMTQALSYLDKTESVIIDPSTQALDIVPVWGQMG